MSNSLDQMSGSILVHLYKLLADIINRRKNEEICYQCDNTVNSYIFREDFAAVRSMGGGSVVVDPLFYVRPIVCVSSVVVVLCILVLQLS